MINWGTIIVSFVSFLLGLLGSLFIQWLGDWRRLKRIKGALKLHLRDIILTESKSLRDNYERIIHHIQDGAVHKEISEVVTLFISLSAVWGVKEEADQAELV